MKDINSLSHTKWNCKCHIVFAPKYRRKEFYWINRIEIEKILRELCNWKFGGIFILLIVSYLMYILVVILEKILMALCQIVCVTQNN